MVRYRDGQGNVSAVADNSGAVLEAYEYNAQGQVQITNGSGTVLSATGISNSLMYAGQRYDLETGNYFCNARYYNLTLGRFISRDPLSDAEFSQGTNLYAYCGNDCVNEADPSGMSARLVEGEIQAWVGQPEYYWTTVAPSAQVSSKPSSGPQSTRDNSWDLDVLLERNGVNENNYLSTVFMGMGMFDGAGEATGVVRIAASEKRALAMGKQIFRDLGREAQRDFHDMKLPGAPDRTLEELKADARSLYEDAGMTPPSWMQ